MNSATEVPIVFVVTATCSAAPRMPFAVFVESRATWETWAMFRYTSCVPRFASATLRAISAVAAFCSSTAAVAVCRTSSLTSLATTAKPFPASPARAASIVALSARRFVCWAIDVMTLTT
jgi:hypothetical protein